MLRVQLGVFNIEFWRRLTLLSTLLTSRDLTWSSGRLTCWHASQISVGAHISWDVTYIQPYWILKVDGVIPTLPAMPYDLVRSLVPPFFAAYRPQYLSHMTDEIHPSKRREPFTHWHGVISLKDESLPHNAMKISRPATFEQLLFWFDIFHRSRSG
jgi:hypothetical protein